MIKTKTKSKQIHSHSEIRRTFLCTTISTSNRSLRRERQKENVREWKRSKKESGEAERRGATKEFDQRKGRGREDGKGREAQEREMKGEK